MAVGVGAALAAGLGGCSVDGLSVDRVPAAVDPNVFERVANNTLVHDDFTSYARGQTYTDGSLVGPWKVQFAGYGYATVVDASGRLRLSPKAASSPAETHAALVTTRSSFAASCLRIASVSRTKAQLRSGSAPNPWEAAWLVWDYRDNDHFSYLALRPNGWELGKRDPAHVGGQRFLATGSQPTIPIGVWSNVIITRTATTKKSTTVITLDGRQLVTFVDAEHPYRSGKVGYYTEDAVADWELVNATRC